jgi:pimeloyl-ACP methyl ester carboxylesterase
MSKFQNPYPTIEDDSCFPYSVFGSKTKKPLVLLSGFPDDTFSAWGQENIEAFAKDYYLICLCLPGYAKKPIQPWGYDFNDLITMMHRTIHNLVSEKFFLMGHDWGSIIVQLYQAKYPSDVIKLCLLDIGQDMPFSALAMFYQTWFAIAYVLSQILGFGVGDAFFKIYFILCAILPINPTPNDKVYRDKMEISVLLCYPYYYLLKAALTGQLKSILVPFPTCPILFLFGTGKRIMFHGPEFLARLRGAGCQHIAVRAGHWLQRQQDQIFRTDVRLFFK